MEICPNSMAIVLLLKTHEPRHAHPTIFVQQQMDNRIVIICFHLSSFVGVRREDAHPSIIDLEHGASARELSSMYYI